MFALGPRLREGDGEVREGDGEVHEGDGEVREGDGEYVKRNDLPSSLRRQGPSFSGSLGACHVKVGLDPRLRGEDDRVTDLRDHLGLVEWSVCARSDFEHMTTLAQDKLGIREAAIDNRGS